MIVAVPRETHPGERRVALVPASVAPLVKAGMEVIVEAGAGQAAGHPDQQYVDKGAKIVPSRPEAFAADIVLQVRAAGANPQAGRADLDLYRRGQVVIGQCDPLGEPKLAAEIAAKGVSLFSLELLPRITRAQSMDVLSSQAIDCRLSGGAAGGRGLAQDVPHDDYGRRHAQRGQGVRDRGRRGRFAGHRHGPALGRIGFGLRRPPGREGAGAEPRRQVHRDAIGNDRRPRPRAATPRKWARSSTASSGN